MIMYSAVLPSYKDKGKTDESGKPQEEIKVDDPRNREKARQILASFD